MTLPIYDRVKESSATTGTGTISLAGAETGYTTFASTVGNGNQTYYVIADQSGGNWEVGIGTYTTSGSTLSRTTVLASSNSGSLVSFTSGAMDVFISCPGSILSEIFAQDTTAVSGILKGSSGAIVAATSGTDYVVPAVTTLSSLALPTSQLTGTIATSQIASSAVTYAKIQNVAATSLLGNPTGSAAAPSGITLGSGLSFSGSTLVASGGGGSGTVNSGSSGQVAYYVTSGTAVSGESLSALLDAAIGSTQGDILYRGSSTWSVLAPGTSGQVLTSGGASANPSWGASASVALFAGTSPVTISNTTTPTNLLGTGVGSLTVPSTSIGRSYNLSVRGYLQTASSLAGTLTLALICNGTTYASTGPITVTLSLPATFWDVDIDITFISISGGGQAWIQGRLLSETGTVGGVVAGMVNTASQAASTDFSANPMMLVATWSVASASNVIVQTNTILTQTH